MALGVPLMQRGGAAKAGADDETGSRKVYTDSSRKHGQPCGATFGLFPPFDEADSMSDTVKAILDAAQQRARKAGLPYFGAVTPAEAHALLSARSDAKMIDVRTHAEWDYVGRVPGSFLIEWNSYPDGTRNPRFLDELGRRCVDLSAPVFFFCRSGQRSDGAARLAKDAGYTMAFNVLEGFEGDRDQEGHRGTLGGWRKAGLPWVQG